MRFPFWPSSFSSRSSASGDVIISRPTSRDALSGPEAIAEFAVREHSMINSFFNIDLSTTNNQFKSPFLISLQMICKMAGFPIRPDLAECRLCQFYRFPLSCAEGKITPHHRRFALAVVPDDARNVCVYLYDPVRLQQHGLLFSEPLVPVRVFSKQNDFMVLFLGSSHGHRDLYPIRDIGPRLSFFPAHPAGTVS